MSIVIFVPSFLLSFFHSLAKICTRFSVETSTIKLKLLTQCAEWPQFTVDYGNLACCTWGCSSYSGPLRTAGQNDTDWLILSYIKNSCEWLTLSPLIPLRLYTLPYWSNPPFLIFDIRALWRSGLSARVPECQKLKMVG